MNREVCTQPTVFARGPEVCGTCGNLLSAHAEEHKTYDLPLKKALWKVLLEHGGIWNQYADDFEGSRFNTVPGKPGTVWRNDMAKLIFHLEFCGLDWNKTRMPKMADFSEWQGSFAPSTMVQHIAGIPVCKCGEYDMYDDSVGIKDITLSQLIWHAVHADDQ